MVKVDESAKIELFKKLIPKYTDEELEAYKELEKLKEKWKERNERRSA